jgi:hypothetical protein
MKKGVGKEEQRSKLTEKECEEDKRVRKKLIIKY